ncbi:hypothetical protein, partial [Streptomyces canarius]
MLQFLLGLSDRQAAEA